MVGKNTFHCLQFLQGVSGQQVASMSHLKHMPQANPGMNSTIENTGQAFKSVISSSKPFAIPRNDFGATFEKCLGKCEAKFPQD
jgi:hypothetical protein